MCKEWEQELQESRTSHVSYSSLPAFPSPKGAVKEERNAPLTPAWPTLTPDSWLCYVIRYTSVLFLAITGSTEIRYFCVLLHNYTREEYGLIWSTYVSRFVFLCATWENRWSIRLYNKHTGRPHLKGISVDAEIVRWILSKWTHGTACTEIRRVQYHIQALVRLP